VAADAKAAGLFNYQPDEIGFIQLAEKQGLGTADFDSLAVKKVSV